MDGAGRVVVVVRSGARSETVIQWLRALLPAVMLALTPMQIPEGAQVVTIDADEVVSGPLALADLLARRVAAGEAHQTHVR